MCHARLLSPIHHMLSSSLAHSVDGIVLMGCCGNWVENSDIKNVQCLLHPQKLSVATSGRAPSSLVAVLCFSCSWDIDDRAGWHKSIWSAHEPKICWLFLMIL